MKNTERLNELKESRLFYISLFILIIIGAGIFCLKNRDLVLGPDHYRYVIEGVSLARGELGEEFWLARVFPDSPFLKAPAGSSFGNAWLRNGKLYVIQPLGWPLLLAGAYLLGGKSALFLANPLLILLLLVAQYLFVREVLYERGERMGVAFLSVLLLLWLPGYRLLFSSLHPSRDIPGLTFFLWTLYFLARSFRRKERIAFRYLFGAAALAGFSCLIRQTMVWLLLPAAIYLCLHLGGRRRMLIPLAATFFLFLLPLLVENYLAFERWLPQISYLFEEGSPGGIHTMISLNNFPPQMARYSVWIYHLFPAPVLFLALAGIIALRKRTELWFLLIGCPLAGILFFSLVAQAYPRYIYPVFPALAALVAVGSWNLIRWPWSPGRTSRGFKAGWVILGLLLGLISLFRLIRSPEIRYFDLFLLVLATSLVLSRILPSSFFKKCFSGPAALVLPISILILVYFCTALTGHDRWQLQKQFRLSRVLPEYIPEPIAILLAARNLSYNLDFHTRFHSLPPAKFEAFSGLNLARAIEELGKQNIPVYFLDNKGKENAGKYLPYLESFFSVVPIVRFNSAALGVDREDLVENELLTLYRIRNRGKP